MFEKYENFIIEKVKSYASATDPAHDFLHFDRVVKTAKKIALEEKAQIDIVMPAAWLHDIVNLPKNHPDRKKASVLSAQAAVEFLQQIKYPQHLLDGVFHAVEAHSFSAQITPRTIEAKIVQDADRLDAIGAIGIARCFSVGAQLQRPIYAAKDPFAHSRELNDQLGTLDHFYVKLFKLPELMQTQTGRIMAEQRIDSMKSFLKNLEQEI